VIYDLQNYSKMLIRDLSSHILMSTSVLEPLQQLRVVGVTASSFQDPNIPQNVLDADDLSTRFSVEGKGQWLEFDFGGEQDVSGIDVGSERSQNFEIFTSDGNTTIAKVAAAKSSGQTNSPERYDLPQSTKASHLRFVNQGNTQNDRFVD
jgi:poly(beta-D-mannuronate) lyase